MQSAITCPPALESSFHDPLAVFLNGNGKCLHIINDKVSLTGAFSLATHFLIQI